MGKKSNIDLMKIMVIACDGIIGAVKNGGSLKA